MNNRKLNILVVVTEFPSVSETFILNQISDLIDKGHAVKIFAYNKKKNVATHQIYNDYNLDENTFFHFKNNKSIFSVLLSWISFFALNFRKINYRLLFSLLNPFDGFKGFKKINPLYNMPIFLFKETYDVIHCHFGYNGKKIANLKKTGVLKNEKIIVSFHGSDLTPSRIEEYKSLYKDMFFYTNEFTVNSPFLLAILKQVNPIIKNVTILPVGFKSRYLLPYLNKEVKKSSFDIVFCGRLMKLKGPDRAIEIVNQLLKENYKNVVLHIIGEGEMYDSLLNLVDNLKMADSVVFYGAIPQERVFEIMAKSDVLLLPGIIDSVTKRAETQGLVIQEAQFLNLPVIVSDVGGIKYGMVDNKSGFLISFEHLDLFVQKIKMLYDNPNLKIEMGHSGHEFVKNSYESKFLGDILLSLYLR